MQMQKQSAKLKVDRALKKEILQRTPMAWIKNSWKHTGEKLFCAFSFFCQSDKFRFPYKYCEANFSNTLYRNQPTFFGGWIIFRRFGISGIFAEL